MTCFLCNQVPANVFCICSDMPRICSFCRAAHESKPGFHFFLPIAGLGAVTPENQREFRAWQLCVVNSHEKLRENLRAIEQCREAIEASHATTPPKAENEGFVGPMQTDQATFCADCPQLRQEIAAANTQNVQLATTCTQLKDQLAKSAQRELQLSISAEQLRQQSAAMQVNIAQIGSACSDELAASREKLEESLAVQTSITCAQHEQLTATCEALKQELAGASKRLAQLNDTCECQLQEIAKLDSFCTQIKQDKDAAELNATQLAATSGHLREEIAVLQKQKSDLNTALEEERLEGDVRRKREDELTAVCERLQQEVATAGREGEQLKSEHAAACAVWQLELVAGEQREAKLNATCAQLSQELVAAHQWKAERDMKSERLSQEIAVTKQLNAVIQQLKLDNNLGKHREVELKATCDQLRGKLAKADEQEVNLRAAVSCQLQDLEAALQREKQVMAKCNDLSIAVKAADEKLKQEISARTKLKRQLEQLDASCADLRRDLDTAAEHERTCAAMFSRDIAAASARESKLNAVCAQLRQDVAAGKERETRLKASCDKLRQELAALNATCAKLRDAIYVYQQASMAKLAQDTAVASERDKQLRAEPGKQPAAASCEQLRSTKQLEAVTKEKTLIQAAFEQLQRELATVKERESQLETSISTLRTEYRVGSQREAREEKLSEQLAAAKSAITIANALKAQSASECKQLARELETAQKRITQLDTVCAQLRQNAKSSEAQVDMLNQRVKVVNEKLAAESAEKASLYAECRQLRQECVSAKQWADAAVDTRCEEVEEGIATVKAQDTRSATKSGREEEMSARGNQQSAEKSAPANIRPSQPASLICQSCRYHYRWSGQGPRECTYCHFSN